MGWRSIRAALCPIMRGRRTGVRSVSKLREMIMAGICRGGENAAVLMQKVGHKGQRANVKRVGRGDGEGAAMEESGRLVIPRTHPTPQFRRVERVLSTHIQKVERTKCYPDFVSCCGRLKVSCIWKEKIICLTGESLLMEELRYGAVAEQ